jgi:hypothetical protein
MSGQAFGKESLSHTQVCEWHARFRACQTSIRDGQLTGRSISSTTPNTVATLDQLIYEDRCRTIQDLADEIGTFQRILRTELIFIMSPPNLCP